MHHVLEHFDYAAGLSLLRELRRCVRRDGALRIAVPNLRFLAKTYCDEGDGDQYGMIPPEYRLSDFNEINDECEKSPTDAMRLHSILQGNDHRAFYDRETLFHQLDQAGWVASEASFRSTKVERVKQILKETSEMSFGGVSLFVDAVPKLG